MKRTSARRALLSLLLATPLLAGALPASAAQVSAGPSGQAGGGRARAARILREVPGRREFSGRLIARPLQLGALLDAGASATDAARRRSAARAELSRYELVRQIPSTDETLLRVPGGMSERQVVRALTATGNFEYVEPDWLLSPIGGQVPVPSSKAALPQAGQRTGSLMRCPDDPMFFQQWHHQQDRMQSCSGWAFHTGKPRITVAICDTGIRTTHEDLLLHRLEAYNAVDRVWESAGGKIGPIYPHGTKVTGTAAANGDNGVGVVGMGWDLSHRMIRVSNLGTGNAFLSDIQHGVRTAAESGDRVINVSYAGVSSASNKTTATYVKSLGSLMLWGAGNESGNLSFSDRDADDLIVVGATDQNDALASFSNYGSFVDLVAPGTGILTTDSAFDSDYAVVQGTSFACPLAAGACAVIWSERPTLSPADVERILKLGVDDIGLPGLDDTFGYGRLNLRKALANSGAAVPLVDFTATPTAGVSPLSVEFRDQSTGVPTSWAWDFGDGATSSLQNPSHSYANLGAYTVSLTIGNKLGTDTVVRTGFVLVDVIPPAVDFSATPTAGLSPLLVNFTDTSTLGVPTTWAWDFGDGTTSALQHPSHSYTASGSYTVTLTASNAYGSDMLSRFAFVLVDVIPPVAAFSGLPLSGASPMVVDFTDESTAGVASSWSWTFGDGTTSTLQHPSHTYTVAGSYTVSLKASNAYGSDTQVMGGYVQVLAGPAIVSNFVASPLSGVAPLQVSFTDLSIGNTTSWMWQFGDGVTSTLQNPVHVYSTPGLYSVILQVGNALGDDDCLELEDYISIQ